MRPPLLFLLLPLLVVVGPTPDRATADDRDAGFVRLEAPVVLRTAAIPDAVARTLPRGREIRPIRLPLPDGPLLVVGLLDADAAARGLASAWGLVALGDDLEGGYLVAAWLDGERPVVALFADDVAALRVARRELDAAPARPPRRVDVRTPPSEGGLRVRVGIRTVRPRHAVRALDPVGRPQGAALRAASARANRLWVDVGADRGEAARDALEACARHGLEPVLAFTASAGTTPTTIANGFSAWRGPGRTRLAVRWSGPGALPDPWVVELRNALRHGGALDELTIVDLTQREPVTVLDARYRYETWVAAHADPAAPPRIPTRPWGRAPTPRVDGIVVVGGPGTEAILRDAWAAPEDEREEWEIQLLPLLPHGISDPAAFLRASAAALAGVARETMGAVPWMAPLAQHLAVEAERLPPHVLAAPRIPAGGRADDTLDEAAWRFAGGAALRGGGRLLGYTDGRRLHLALRGLQEGHTVRWILRDGTGGDDAGPANAEARREVARRGGTVETIFDERVLGGAPYPTRVFRLRVEIESDGGARTAFDGAVVLVP